MPQKRTKKTTARTAPAKKAAAKRNAAAPKPKTAAAPKPADVAPVEAAPPQGGTCPRCGTAKFGPEQRTRAEGSRTVRYTILVCERGHTFAKPRETPA